MVESLRRRPRATRIAVAIAVVAALPFLVPVTIESEEFTNGELTSYSYLDLTALVGGLVAVGYAFRARSAARVDGELTAKVKALLAVLVLVGVFQVVRGSGVVPHLTDCSAEYSLDLCRPAE
ncbi:hypothetical protein [Streptomyces sp. NPDC018031]|uniref:hypothetical protein n=1 Tax=Streptomyces sp. NPDC018031 TaxID=3365033 RepID=UPI0037BD60FB